MIGAILLDFNAVNQNLFQFVHQHMASKAIGLIWNDMLVILHCIWQAWG